MQPHRMVIQVFKVIAIAMVMVFVFDIVFYLYRALHLNQRMESICVALQKVVSENNYLPEDEYVMFESIFNQIKDQMNGRRQDGTINDGSFIRSIDINYNHGVVEVNPIPSVIGKKYNQSTGNYQSNVELVRDRQSSATLATPADYGDVRLIEVTVEVVQPMWDMVGGIRATSWQNDRTDASITAPTTTFTYSYLVPCLNYQAVTGN